MESVSFSVLYIVVDIAKAGDQAEAGETGDTPQDSVGVEEFKRKHQSGEEQAVLGPLLGSKRSEDDFQKGCPGEYWAGSIRVSVTVPIPESHRVQRWLVACRVFLWVHSRPAQPALWWAHLLTR